MSVERDVAIQQFMENLGAMERNLQALLAASRSWSSQARGQQALRLVMRDFHQLQARSLDLMREIGHMDAQRQHLTAAAPQHRRPSGTASPRQDIETPASPPPPEPVAPPPPKQRHPPPAPPPPAARPPAPRPPVSLSFGADDDLLADEPVAPDPPTPAPRHDSSSLSKLMSSMPEEVRKRLEKRGIE